MQLELADPGWLRIDDATLRVSGPLHAVVREMGDILSDEAVRSLCSKLGILSSGFFFIDPHEGWTRFFDQDERRKPKTYRTQYVWFDESAGQQWSDLIHWLFVHVRATQRTYAKKAKKRTEDFFRHIPKDSGAGYCVAEADRVLRLKYAIHYVTLGEMVFTMLAWRSLIAAVSRGKANAPLDQLNIGFEDEHNATLSCPWGGSDLLNRGHSGTGTGRWGQLRNAWEVLARSSLSLRSEWHGLGVHQSDYGPPSTQFVALTRFAIAAGAIGDGDAPQMTCALMNGAIQKNIASFLRHLGLKREPRNVRDALSAIERYSRFPLLPFYAWHALDRAPKCYLVTPVWTSQRYSVEVDDAKCRRCRHLGLALSAVSPLRRIDWTLPADLPSNNGIHSSDADPVVVANLIRLMARPLVEEHLYGKELRELKARVKEQANAKVQESIGSGGDQAKRK
jgi:hypothetical protein